MKITYGRQIQIDDLANKEIDLFLCAENHEKRSLTLYNKLILKNKISKSIALCYQDLVIDDKDIKLKKVKISYNDHLKIYKFLDDELQQIHKKEISIIVDYSCMTKSWYYSIILYLKNKNNVMNNITVYFSYTPAKFNEPKLPKPNKEIIPLPGKYVVPTDKPKALIVCLGYEQNKAEGIIEHLDPKLSYLFYTKPASDKKFVNAIEFNNKSLLDERSKFIVTFPYDDLLYLERELTRLYNLLKEEYSIVIAPLGPKPFTFISMLMSIKYDDIDIWRVGSGNDINEYENESINDNSFIICETFFE